MAAEWQITCWYLAMLLLVALLAKLTSYRLAGGRHWAELATSSFFWSPWFCAKSWQRRPRLTAGTGRPVVASCVADIALVTLVYATVIPLLAGLPWWLQSYLAAVPFWLLLKALSSLCQLVWLVFGQLVPSIDHQPWRSVSLADFWGRRWNRLIGDWLAQAVFSPLKRRPRLAMLATFAVSGALHELVVSLPLTAVYGESVWGWFIGYFCLQFGGCTLERKLRLPPLARRLMLWAVVLLPLPLVLNRGTLLIFHLGG